MLDNTWTEGEVENALLLCRDALSGWANDGEALERALARFAVFFECQGRLCRAARRASREGLRARAQFLWRCYDQLTRAHNRLMDERRSAKQPTRPGCRLTFRLTTGQEEQDCLVNLPEDLLHAVLDFHADFPGQMIGVRYAQSNGALSDAIEISSRNYDRRGARHKLHAQLTTFFEAAQHGEPLLTF